MKSKIVANVCLAKVSLFASVMEDVDGHVFPFHGGQRRNQKWFQTLNFKSRVSSAQMAAHLAGCSRVCDYAIHSFQFVPLEVV